MGFVGGRDVDVVRHIGGRVGFRAAARDPVDGGAVPGDHGCVHAAFRGVDAHAGRVVDAPVVRFRRVMEGERVRTRMPGARGGFLAGVPEVVVAYDDTEVEPARQARRGAGEPQLGAAAPHVRLERDGPVGGRHVIGAFPAGAVHGEMGARVGCQGNGHDVARGQGGDVIDMPLQRDARAPWVEADRVSGLHFLVPRRVPHLGESDVPDLGDVVRCGRACGWRQSQ